MTVARIDGKGAGLLRSLCASPALPAYIRQLPAPAVARLLREVGLEDSHEILAALTAQQLRETVSIMLWASPGAGQDEALDAEALVRWMELWREDGDAVLSRRLIEVGEDLLVACFRELLTGIDRTACGVLATEPCVEIGPYVVYPQQRQHWPRIVEALLALWEQEPDFLLRVLRRCSHERSILNETAAESAADDTLRQDLTAERAAQRAQAGHVSPVEACLFLSAARSASLGQLCVLQEYDLGTATHLAQAELLLEKAGFPAARPQARDERAEAHTRRRLADTHSSEFAHIDRLLREAGVLEPRAAGLLADPGASPGSLSLEAALAELARERSEVAAVRMRELAYLANVLVAGTEPQGGRYSEARAARVALATTQLGATYLLRADAGGKPGVSVTRMLERSSMIRLFQIGIRLLAQIPPRCCEAVYAAKDVQSRRPGHLVHREMEQILGERVLADLLLEGRYAESRSVIDELSAVMDAAACVCLRMLIDPIPVYPLALDPAAPGTRLYVDRRHRPIASIDDLVRIGEFLGSLARCCG